MRYDAHVTRISHDGSGTIITHIELVNCPDAMRCDMCDLGITKIPVDITQHFRARAIRPDSETRGIDDSIRLPPSRL